MNVKLCIPSAAALLFLSVMGSPAQAYNPDFIVPDAASFPDTKWYPLPRLNKNGKLTHVYMNGKFTAYTPEDFDRLPINGGYLMKGGGVWVMMEYTKQQTLPSGKKYDYYLIYANVICYPEVSIKVTYSEVGNKFPNGNIIRGISSKKVYDSVNPPEGTIYHSLVKNYCPIVKKTRDEELEKERQARRKREQEDARNPRIVVSPMLRRLDSNRSGPVNISPSSNSGYSWQNYTRDSYNRSLPPGSYNQIKK